MTMIAMPAGQLSPEDFTDVISRMTPEERMAVEDAMLVALGAGALLAVIDDEETQANIVREAFDIHPGLSMPPLLEKVLSQLEGKSD